MTPPASSTTARADAKMAAIASVGSRSGNAAMFRARTTRPTMAKTSLHAFAAAIAPKSSGSSTSGGKKSVVETKARPSAKRRTAASSNGANPTSSSPAAVELPISRTSADRGDPPHLAAQPPQDVHSVSLSAPSATATTGVSQEREDRGRVTLKPGAKVEVRTSFDESWARGFEVEAVTDEGYRLRRMSDGSLLPVVLPERAVRSERRDANMWWV